MRKETFQIIGIEVRTTNALHELQSEKVSMKNYPRHLYGLD